MDLTDPGPAPGVTGAAESSVTLPVRHRLGPPPCRGCGGRARGGPSGRVHPEPSAGTSARGRRSGRARRAAASPLGDLSAGRCHGTTAVSREPKNSCQPRTWHSPAGTEDAACFLRSRRVSIQRMVAAARPDLARRGYVRSHDNNGGRWRGSGRHAGGLLRARQSHERAGAQPLHPGVARFRSSGAPTARDPGRSPRTGTSTPPRSRRCRGRAPSTTSTASRRSSSTVDYPAPGCPSWLRRSATSSHPPGWAPTPTPGASTTAPGRCSCTRFPTPTIPVVQLSHQRRQGPRLPPRARAAARAAARARRPHRRQRQRRAQPARHELGPGRRRVRLGAALRRGRQER